LAIFAGLLVHYVAYRQGEDGSDMPATALWNTLQELGTVFVTLGVGIILINYFGKATRPRITIEKRDLPPRVIDNREHPDPSDSPFEDSSPEEGFQRRQDLDI